MNMWRKKDYFRHILYTFVDMAVVPIIRRMAAIGLSRPVHAVTALYRHILWQTKLGYMGAESCLWPHVVIHNPQNVQIGAYVSIAEFVHIWGGGGITIGNNVLIAAHVVITSQTHNANGLEVFRHTLIQAPVVIENNVWIGSGAIILPGVQIRQGSIVGAGSVVTRDVPENTIVVGVPARAIRRKDSE